MTRPLGLLLALLLASPAFGQVIEGPSVLAEHEGGLVRFAGDPAGGWDVKWRVEPAGLHLTATPDGLYLTGRAGTYTLTADAAHFEARKHLDLTHTLRIEPATGNPGPEPPIEPPPTPDPPTTPDPGPSIFDATPATDAERALRIAAAAYGAPHPRPTDLAVGLDYFGRAIGAGAEADDPAALIARVGQFTSLFGPRPGGAVSDAFAAALDAAIMPAYSHAAGAWTLADRPALARSLRVAARGIYEGGRDR